MAHKRGILIVSVAIGLMLVSISCATAQAPPQQSPMESQTPMPSQPTPPLNQTPSGLRNLTDAEKEKVIQIALKTPEAKSALETYGIYKAEFQWAAIVWEGSVIKEHRVINYDIVEWGIPPELPASAIIYPHILFHFGELEPAYPEGRYLVDVTVDLVNEKAVGLVVTHPLKKLPVP